MKKSLRTLYAAAFLTLLSGCPAGTMPIIPMDPGPNTSRGGNMSFDYGPGLGWGLLALPVNRTEEKEDIAPSDLAKELRVGDIATIFTKKNKEHTFRVYRVGPEDFWGEARDGKKYQVPYKHLVKVVVDRESAGYRVVIVLWIGARIIGSTTQLPNPRGALKEA